jgi:prepilin-type N-terminal cleavage/methylation domain-containing protein
MAIIVKRKLISLKGQGFTLIELLVVIGIIGLLSTLAVLSLSDSGPKARDAKRMSDIKALRNAIELFIYTNPTNKYDLPGGSPAQPTRNYYWLDTLGYGFGHDLAPLMAGKIPMESNSDKGVYFYCKDTANKKYVVGTILEQNINLEGEIDGVLNFGVESIFCLSSYQGGNYQLYNESVNCNDSNTGGVRRTSAPAFDFRNHTTFCLGTI